MIWYASILKHQQSFPEKSLAAAARAGAQGDSYTQQRMIALYILHQRARSRVHSCKRYFNVLANLQYKQIKKEIEKEINKKKLHNAEPRRETK